MQSSNLGKFVLKTVVVVIVINVTALRVILLHFPPLVRR